MIRLATASRWWTCTMSRWCGSCRTKRCKRRALGSLNPLPGLTHYSMMEFGGTRMDRRAGIILVVALLLLPVGLLGVASGANSGAYTQAAFIYNLGAGDFAGFRIAVDPNGKAWAIDGGGRASGELDKDIVRRFFSDLSAASPLEKLPNQPCPATRADIQTPTDISAALIVTWRGASSPDLTCAHDRR